MIKTLYLAGGCFWGVEHYLSLLQGVLSTQVGYANGRTDSPSYEDVCRRDTGHAEAVKVSYDPEMISLPFLLDQFYAVIDPTSLNKQGHDEGTQYRTGIYYTDADERPLIEASLQKLQQDYAEPLAIECLPLRQFFPAEEYHQDYLNKNPQGYCHLPLAAFDYARSARESRSSDHLT